MSFKKFFERCNSSQCNKCHCLECEIARKTSMRFVIWWPGTRNVVMSWIVNGMKFDLKLDLK